MLLVSNPDDEMLFSTITICKAHSLVDQDLNEFGISRPMIHVYRRIFFQFQELPLHGVPCLALPYGLQGSPDKPR